MYAPLQETSPENAAGRVAPVTQHALGALRRGWVGVLVVSVALVLLPLAGGCGDGTAPSDSSETTAGEAETVEVALEPVGGSGVGGTVGIAPAGDGVEITLSLQNLPDREAGYIGAIYEGSCAAVHGQAGRGVYAFVHEGHGDSLDEEGLVQTLSSVTPAESGGGTSVTPLPVSARELLSAGPRYVDVHRDAEVAVACANLPEMDAT